MHPKHKVTRTFLFLGIYFDCNLLVSSVRVVAGLTNAETGRQRRETVLEEINGVVGE